MKENWVAPKVLAIDFAETMNSIVTDENPDGAFGAIFVGGIGGTNPACCDS